MGQVPGKQPTSPCEPPYLETMPSALARRRMESSDSPWREGSSVRGLGRVPRTQPVPHTRHSPSCGWPHRSRMS